MIPCPLCGKESQLFQKNGVVGVPDVDMRLCESCSVGFQSPMPSQEDLVTYYKEAYRDDGEFTATSEENFTKQAALAHVRWDRYMKEYFGPEVIALDVACGTGNMMRLIAEQGATVDGVEAYEPYADKAREFGIVQTAMVEDMRLARKYNTVLLMHILEHLRDPSAFLASLTPHLTDGTRLFVECPNVRNVMISGYQIDETVPRFSRPHLWEFSPEGMKQLLEQHGWVVESVIPYQRSSLVTHLWRLFNLATPGQEEDVLSMGMQPPVREAIVKSDVAYRQALEAQGLTDTFIIRAVHP